MLKLEYSSQFKKDFKKIAKLAIPDVIEVGHVIKQLQLDDTLPEKYRDHPLTGDWQHYRDCHVKPDLVPLDASPPNKAHSLSTPPA